MLALEVDKPFDDKQWIFEIKWDGYRALAEIQGKQVKLYSRNGNLFNDVYPLVASELAKIKVDALLDGEIAVTDDSGRPSFQLLQDYENSGGHLQYFVFDVLSVDGKDTCGLTLLQRKELLKELLIKSDVVKYSDHIVGKGKDFFSLTGKRGLEGMMAKKADSEYYPGKRTREWLKIKHNKTQEAFIAGFTEPTGARNFFGALVLGMRKGKELKYIGHTGSGFTKTSLREMSALLRPLIQKESPFSEKVKTNMPVTWVAPVLVCEVKFTEWTNEGRMRHPIFIHLRPDKSLTETNMAITKKSSSTPGRSSKKNDRVYTFGKIEVKTTNHNKIFWPGDGITKGDVIEYYIGISDFIMPYLKQRPQSLKRNPNGILDHGFYHKDAGDDAPEWVDSIKLFSESTNKDVDYILCNNKPTLTYMNNLGCIEINPWHSTVRALDKPDYMIIDLDPSKKNTFAQVVETANVVHEVLNRVKAENFCKTSGATGLHVYVPMGRKYTYDQIKDFAHLICMMTNDQLPAFTSLERNLKKRGEMIYLDHLQNRRGQTIASAYSIRPHPGATVSTPLHWKEVNDKLSPDQFDIYSVPKRLKKIGDIFSGILGKGIDLEKCLKRMLIKT